MADFAKHETSQQSADAAHAAQGRAAPDSPSLSGRGDSSAPITHVNLERCRLSLIKGEHRWRFRWERGSEAALISAVADLARDPRCEFDWFDAAIVCRQIAHNTHPAKAATSAHPAHKPPHLPAQISRASEK